MDNHPHPVRRLSFNARAQQYDEVSSLGYNTGIQSLHASKEECQYYNNSNNNYGDYETAIAEAVPLPVQHQLHQDSRRSTRVPQESSRTMETSRSGSTDDNSASVVESSVQMLPSPSVQTSSSSHTIALFGGEGKTGQYFIRLAVDAGYQVRALLPPTEPTDQHHNSLLQVISGNWINADLATVQRTLRGAEYCVCLLNDTLPSKKQEYEESCLKKFVKLLYKGMRTERKLQVFLYQATSLAPDIQGGMPIMARILKTVAQFKGPFLLDQAAALKHISKQHAEARDDAVKENQSTAERASLASETAGPCHFDYIITRPTILLRDGPSTKKLSASRSQPGPVPVSYVDLAEFTLNALVNDKLRNSCPYVVADSF